MSRASVGLLPWCSAPRNSTEVQTRPKRKAKDSSFPLDDPFPTFLLPYIQPIQQGSDVDLLIDPAMRLTNEVPCVVDKLSFEMGKEEIITKPFATINSLGCLGGFKIELGVQFEERGHGIVALMPFE